MSRRPVIWIVVANCIVVMLLMCLFAVEVIPVRPTGAFVLPFLLVVDFLAFRAASRSGSNTKPGPPKRLSPLVWVVVGIYSLEALGALIRFAVEPNRVTAGVAVASAVVGVLGWLVIYRARRSPASRVQGKDGAA